MFVSYHISLIVWFRMGFRTSNLSSKQIWYGWCRSEISNTDCENICASASA